MFRYFNDLLSLCARLFNIPFHFESSVKFVNILGISDSGINQTFLAFFFRGSYCRHIFFWIPSNVIIVWMSLSILIVLIADMVASGFQYCMVWATSSVTNFKDVDNKIAMTAEKLSQVTNSFPANPGLKISPSSVLLTQQYLIELPMNTLATYCRI